MGAGMQNPVPVMLRPVTQNGIQGLSTKAQGPGRTVHDRSYFLQELTKRSQNIYEEVNKFKKQTEEITKNNGLFQTLEKRYEDLTKEVRNLEGKARRLQSGVR